MNIQKLEAFINELVLNMLWSGSTTSAIMSYMNLIKDGIDGLKRHPDKPKWVEVYNNQITNHYNAMCELIKSKNPNIKEIPPIEN